jgi:type IV pilus assembly protein PilQ
MNNHQRRFLTLVSLLAVPVLSQAQEPDLTPNVVTVTSDTVAPTVDNSGAAGTPLTQSTDAPPETTSAEAIPASETEAPKKPVVVVAPLPEVVPSPPPKQTATESEKPKDTLSVDFPDEDIRNILRNVADLFELNIVIPDTLQGRTSLKLRDVTWRQIFKVVLTPVSYTFVEDGNIIKVVTTDSLATEPLTTEVFVLSYARAEDVEKSIKPLVNTATGGSVLVDKRINALVISERPSMLARITPVLTDLDKETQQVRIESKFIEVLDNTERDIGLKWNAVGDISTGALQRTVTAGKNALPTTPGGTPAGYSYSAGVLSAIEFDASLKLINDSGDSREVANPTVVTLNNTKAFINVGQEYPIPKYTYNSEQGRFEVSGFEYKPIGIILTVTPQINNRGFIKLTVEPEISTIDTEASAEFSGSGIPVIKSRKTVTQVSLKSGHTLGIGGLIADFDSNTVSKLPFFSSLPVVGRLFTSKSKKTDRKNLLIFITAKIVSADSASSEDVFDRALIKRAGLRRSDLPGVQSKEDPFLPEIVETADENSAEKTE